MGDGELRKERKPWQKKKEKEEGLEEQGEKGEEEKV